MSAPPVQDRVHDSVTLYTAYVYLYSTPAAATRLKLYNGRRLGSTAGLSTRTGAPSSNARTFSSVWP
jgi:hypothetical protein